MCQLLFPEPQIINILWYSFLRQQILFFHNCSSFWRVFQANASIWPNNLHFIRMISITSPKYPPKSDEQTQELTRDVELSCHLSNIGMAIFMQHFFHIIYIFISWRGQREIQNQEWVEGCLKWYSTMVGLCQHFLKTNYNLCVPFGRSDAFSVRFLVFLEILCKKLIRVFQVYWSPFPFKYFRYLKTNLFSLLK